MIRRVLFEPEASAELEEAARWDEAQRSGLGLTFLAAVDGAVAHTAAWPGSGISVPGVPVSLSVRLLPVSPIPSRIADLVASEELRVLAVAHTRRRPGSWRSRTQP